LRIQSPGLHLFLVILGLLSTCQQKQSVPQTAFIQPNQDTLITSGGVLLAALNAEPETLNPLSALSEPARQVIGLIFLRLANINSDLTTFTPSLATKWDTLPDARALRFHLRTDVRWQDGVPVTARDVQFTFRLQSNPAYGWDGLPFKTNITKVAAIDDSTVIFFFKHPSRTMLMDAVEGEILPEHVLREMTPDQLLAADFNQQPVGNGPFQLVEWKPQQTIILKRNPDYYDYPRPYLDRVIFKIIPDNANLTRQLLSGELDLAENLLPRDFERLSLRWREGKGNLRPVSFLGRQYDFIAWNLVEPSSYRSLDHRRTDNIIDKLRPHRLFGSRTVRAALTMALDRQRIGEIVNGELFRPMNGPIPLILWAYNPNANHIWEYNPARARQLLSAEGWQDNDYDGILEKGQIKFQFEMLTNSGNIRRQHALTLIQDQLKAIGVAMRPRLVEPQVLIEKFIVPREFDALLFGWNVGLKMELTSLFHSSTFFHPFHFTSYYSTTFDILEDRARAALDTRLAQQQWDKIAALLSEELPYTWLYYKVDCAAIHKRFRNVIIDQRGVFVNVAEWWIPAAERLPHDRLFLNQP